MTQPNPRKFAASLLRHTNRRFLFLVLGLITLSGLAPTQSFAGGNQRSDRLGIRSAFHRFVSLFRSRSHQSSASHRSSAPLPKLVVVGKAASKNTYKPPKDKSVAADTLIFAVQEFIAAGETNDIAQRATYLAPQGFFYGHNRSREQASREMTYFNRAWPRRKYAAPEAVDVYAIPNRPGAYKVVSVYEYEMVSREQERMTGKARLTFIFEYGNEGPRIVGVDEKLLSETTRFYRNYNSIPVASNEESQLAEAKITASR
jgi:hypothetical protein